MELYRILVLGVTFSLVAISPCIEVALVVLAFGVFMYSALWCYDLFKRKDKS